MPGLSAEGRRAQAGNRCDAATSHPHPHPVIPEARPAALRVAGIV